MPLLRSLPQDLFKVRRQSFGELDKLRPYIRHQAGKHRPSHLNNAIQVFERNAMLYHRVGYRIAQFWGIRKKAFLQPIHERAIFANQLQQVCTGKVANAKDARQCLVRSSRWANNAGIRGCCVFPGRIIRSSETSSASAASPFVIRSSASLSRPSV